MRILFWFVVHLCQTLKRYRVVVLGGGKKELHSKMYIFFLKPWIIALENILVVYMFLLEILCSTNRKALHLYCEPHWISTSLFVFKSSSLCIPNCEHLKVLNVMTAVVIHSGIHFIHSFKILIKLDLRWLHPTIFFLNSTAISRVSVWRDLIMCITSDITIQSSPLVTRFAQ